MRIAALYDIHGNLPALQAVLGDIRREDVDQIVVGGDVVLGPMPRETLAVLRDLDRPVRFIQGNCDREVLALMRGTETGTLREQIRGVVQWVAQELRFDDEQMLASWPETLRIELSDGDVVFCHATPRNDMEIFTRTTPEAVLVPVFEHLDAALVVCGHTHMQFDRMIGSVRVVNAGSVGMPFGEPGAYWLLLGPDVQLRRTTYDLAEAAQHVRATSYPQAEEFAARSVIRPPSEQTILESFAHVALK
jgi:putative phosphoesterase